MNGLDSLVDEVLANEAGNRLDGQDVTVLEVYDVVVGIFDRFLRAVQLVGAPAVSLALVIDRKAGPETAGKNIGYEYLGGSKEWNYSGFAGFDVLVIVLHTQLAEAIGPK